MSMPPYGREQVQPYGMPAAPQPPKTKRKGKGGTLLLIASILGVCMVGGIVAGTFASIAKGKPTQVASSAWAEPAPTVTVTKTVTAKPPANTKAKVTAAKPVTLANGTWEVGDDLQPGKYRTTSDGYCYWARLKDFNGELGSILANGNLDPGAKGLITVRKSDAGLELSGGCTWTRK